MCKIRTIIVPNECFGYVNKIKFNWSNSNNSKTVDGGQNALNIGTNCNNYI